MNMQKEGEFNFYTLPSLSGETKALIVLLHGHASQPKKYLARAREMQVENPDADVVLVQGPLELRHEDALKLYPDIKEDDKVYTWCSLDATPKEHAKLMLRQIFNRLDYLRRLNKFVNNQLKNRNLQDENLALVGFSMGGAVAVQLSLRRRKECAAVVCHSGMVLPLTRPGKKPHTLMVMGDKDEIFFLSPQEKAQHMPALLKVFNKVGLKFDLHHAKSVQRLKKIGVPVEEKVFCNQGHCISDDSWHAASAFVTKNLKLRK